MIAGHIAKRRPLVALTIRDNSGQDRGIETVLDTGFTGYLTLPPATVAAFGLPFAHPMRAILADGSHHVLSVHKGIILWDGNERDIDIIATGTEPLIGMSLLDGSDVRLQVTDGGTITIVPLSIG